MTRRLRYYMECETWTRDEPGTERRFHRRRFDTRADADKAYPKMRVQLQKDFGDRFVELRIVER
jgi:hypothetical protein